jgi:hypothetical protein
MTAPDLYGQYGEEVLGPWGDLTPDVQDAWVALDSRVAWRRKHEGRALGRKSGGDHGFWGQLGVDDAGMPLHLPMGVTVEEEGPANDADAHHWICWCGNGDCPLTLALGHAWRSGRFSG